jgi:predicted NUDIX family NTP pyrophosphohydrolase
MKECSAGILLYRGRGDQLEVLLVHPGGPLWAKKDEGAWSIPKGEYQPGEDPLAAALREFREELGASVAGTPVPLGEVKQKSGKRVAAWAVEGEVSAGDVVSNTFSMEWPPRSGRMMDFPEIDRAAWFAPAAARVKLNPAQHAFLNRLIEHLGGAG